MNTSAETDGLFTVLTVVAVVETSSPAEAYELEGWLLSFREPNVSLAVSAYTGPQLELLVALSHECAPPPLDPSNPQRVHITLATDAGQLKNTAAALEKQLAPPRTLVTIAWRAVRPAPVTKCAAAGSGVLGIAGRGLCGLARTVNDTGRVLPWALYDTGQAIAALTVQASADGLFVHQMGGFDADAARLRFDLGDTLTPVVMVAVGQYDPQAPLVEPLATRERAPRSREALDALLLNDPYQGRRAA